MEFSSTQFKNMLSLCYCTKDLNQDDHQKGNVTPTMGREDPKSNGLLQKIITGRSQKGYLQCPSVG